MLFIISIYIYIYININGSSILSFLWKELKIALWCLSDVQDVQWLLCSPKRRVCRQNTRNPIRLTPLQVSTAICSNLWNILVCEQPCWEFWSITCRANSFPNPPAPKVLVKGYRFTWGGGGPIIRPKPPVFDRSWRSPSKNTVKNSTEDTCSWTRPSKIGKRKVKKPCVFQLFDLNFLVCNIFFCGSAGGLARRRIFEFLDPFRTDFRRFVIAETLVFTVFFCFLHAWRLASKLPKTS